jgi:hypothetical protein
MMHLVNAVIGQERDMQRMQRGAEGWLGLSTLLVLLMLVVAAAGAG